MYFSIIIPVYNVEKYLEQCVDSILCQTYTGYEIILVDDGSTDRSGDICDWYQQKDNRIKVVHKQNTGQADSRNVGTRLAQGKYIVYIDSDDFIIDNEFLDKIQKKAKSDADIICYKFRKYFEESNRLQECTFSMAEMNRFDSMEDKLNYLIRQDSFYCAPWAKAIKRSVLMNGNIEFQSGLLAEDQDWYYLVLDCAQSIEGLDEGFIAYRQRVNSTSRTWSMKNLTDCIYIIKKWERNLSKENVLRNSLAKYYCNLLIAYTRFDNKEKKSYYKEIKELACLLKCDRNPRVKMFNKLYRVAGFEGLMLGLKIVCKLR